MNSRIYYPMYTPQKFVDQCRIMTMAVARHICPDVWNLIVKCIDFDENRLLIEMRILAGVSHGESDENIKKAFEAKFIECTPEIPFFYRDRNSIPRFTLRVPADNGDKVMYIDNLTWQQKIKHVTEVSLGLRFKNEVLRPDPSFVFKLNPNPCDWNKYEKHKWNIKSYNNRD